MVFGVDGLGMKKKPKYKMYVGFNGYKSFVKNDTKYGGFEFGVKLRCVHKIGLSFSWLKGNYKTDLFPVDGTLYTGALETTKTDAQFFSVMYAPVLVRDKKVNVSFPVHLGIAGLNSKYKDGAASYETYHNSVPGFLRLGASFDFRLMPFLKLGLKVAYQQVFTSLPVAKEALNTPLIGFGISFGRMCK